MHLKTLTKEEQEKISPNDALKILIEGNKRFVNNLKVNRNLLQQVNETRDSQHPFAVIISCMDSRTSAELIFDQGLGDIFSIRVAGNVINEDILGSAEFGCKVVGAKIVVVLGHTSCGAIKGAVDNTELGHLHFITSKIQRCLHEKNAQKSYAHSNDLMRQVTYDNVALGIEDLRNRSSILKQLEHDKKIMIAGGVYDLSTGIVDFI
jgi:carbonic anhydrase